MVFITSEPGHFLLNNVLAHGGLVTKLLTPVLETFSVKWCHLLFFSFFFFSNIQNYLSLFSCNMLRALNRFKYKY